VANSNLLFVKYHSCSLFDQDPYILTDFEILSCKSESRYPSSTTKYLYFISSDVISCDAPSKPLILPGLTIEGVIFFLSGDELVPCKTVAIYCWCA